MTGKWITCEREIETPLFRKKFNLANFESASIDISGLGYFTLIVNGRRVSDELFVPAQTDYAPSRDTASFAYPIFDTFTHRVRYLRYNITEYLTVGENTVDVIVGNGWWRQKERIAEGECSYSDRLLTIFDIKVRYTDGNSQIICTDGSEQAFCYPILESNLFLGETVDMRMFSEDLPEITVTVSDFEPEIFELQTCPSDRVIKTLKPKLIKPGNPAVYDVGENISGVVSVKVKGNRGDKVVLRFAEEFRDGDINFETTGGQYRLKSGRMQIQSDCFILSGETEEIRPMFVWHGFRYFDIETSAEILDLTAEVIHTDLAVVSEFQCDNEVLNWLYHAYIRTQLNNLHGCVPSDCPTRERLGYTGDGQLCCGAAALNLDAKEYYKKWLRDIMDCQDKTSGHIQHTAPFMGGGGGPGAWGGAMIIVPWRCYKFFGDISFLEDTYDSMKKWVGYMLNHCDGYLLTHEEKDGWCLGDWGSAEKMQLPEAFVNTCYLVFQLEIMAEISKILEGKTDESYLDAAEKCRSALSSAYFGEGHYCGGIQGADAYGILAKLPSSENLLPALSQKYEKLGYLDTGIFGAYIVPCVLFSGGRGDLAIDLLSSENPKSGYKAMMNRGGTTVYEYPNCGGSADHPMFGAPSEFLFTKLLGIDIESYKDELIIEPCITSKVKRAKGRLDTYMGRISVGFSVSDKSVFEIEIPSGINASLKVEEKLFPLSAGQNRFEF